MKKITVLFILLLFTISGFSQQGFESTTGPNALPSTQWNLTAGLTLNGNWAVFDNGIGPDVRWENCVVGTQYQGSNAAYCNMDDIGPGNTSEDFLATPAIVIPANGQLKFWTRHYLVAPTGTIYEIRIKLASSSAQDTPNNYVVIPGGAWTDATLTNLANPITNYEEKTVTIPASFTGQPVYIAFVMKYTQPGAGASSDRWLVDDVKIVQQCFAPTGLSAGVLPTSATFGWSSNGATSFQIYNGVRPLTPPIATTVPTGASTTNSFNQTGLTVNTDYSFYIRADCGSGNYSPWVSYDYTSTPQPPKNIYNNDGTLQGNRRVDFRGNSLSFGDFTKFTSNGNLLSPNRTNYLNVGENNENNTEAIPNFQRAGVLNLDFIKYNTKNEKRENHLTFGGTASSAWMQAAYDYGGDSAQGNLSLLINPLGGNIGVNLGATLQPQTQLHVGGTAGSTINGQIRFENLGNSSTNNMMVVAQPNGTLSTQAIPTGGGTATETDPFAWRLTGNAGTNTTNNFIGTTDSAGLVFRSNGGTNNFSGAIYNGATSFGYQSNNGNFQTTAFGTGALGVSISGLNSAFGFNALSSNRKGVYNTAIGLNALSMNINGQTNIAVGQETLRDNTSGTGNTAIGFRSLSSNIKGGANTAVGINALIANTTGGNNVGVGIAALSRNISGSQNISVGGGGFVTTGNNNTILGYSAAGGWGVSAGLSSGNNNVVIGQYTGSNLSSGSTNILIGSSVQPNISGADSNQLNIGNWIYGFNGNIGIGPVPNPQNRLEINGTGSGLRFTNLRSTSTPVANPSLATNRSVLSVDSNGDVILVKGQDANLGTASTLAWELAGNALLADSTAFLGTTSNNDLVFRRNGTFGGRLGASNTAFGVNSLANTTGTGTANSAFGVNALSQYSTGSSNVAIGNGAGMNITTGNRNIIIGQGVNAVIGTANDQLNIGSWIFGNAGNIGIGLNTPLVRFHVGEGQVRFNNLAGTGNRMVIADLNGTLNTQAIPTGGLTSIFPGTNITVTGTSATGYTISSTSTVSNTNIYTTDGTLTKERFVNMNNKSLFFSDFPYGKVEQDISLLLRPLEFNKKINAFLDVNTKLNQFQRPNVNGYGMSKISSQMGYSLTQGIFYNDGKIDEEFPTASSTWLQSSLTPPIEKGKKAIAGPPENATAPLLLNPLKGNVGIGVTNPTAQLHTIDSVRFENLEDGKEPTRLLGMTNDGNVFGYDPKSFNGDNNNIYNNDGTLQDERIVDFKEYNLYFNSFSGNNFRFQPRNFDFHESPLFDIQSQKYQEPNLKQFGMLNLIVQDKGKFNRLTQGVFEHAIWLQSAKGTGEEDSPIGNFPMLMNPLGGSVGIGVLNPTAQLHAIDSVRFENLANAEKPAYILGTDHDGNVYEYKPESLGGGSNDSWRLLGNHGTNPGTGIGQNFIGTKDGNDIVFGVNSDEKLRITQTGRLKFFNNSENPSYQKNIYIGGGNDNVASLSGIANWANVAVGLGAMSANTTGYANTATGYNSLSSNTTGNLNCAYGINSLQSLTNGSANVSMGHNSMRNKTAGSFNTAIGDATLFNNQIGNYNTAIGRHSFGNLYNGNNNVALGNLAGNNLTSGDFNIIIGSNTLATDPTGSNQLNIGGWILGNQGSIGIGTLPIVGTRLHTDGSLKFDNLTTAAENTVLTIDANGYVKTRTLNNWGVTTNVLTSNANVMTSLVNGVSSSANIINLNTLSFTSNILTSTVNGVASNPIDLSGFVPTTTHTLNNPVNTITSTVSGVVATAPAVNTVVHSLTGNVLTTTVNGVAGSQDLSSIIPAVGVDTNIYNSNGIILQNRIVAMDSHTLDFNFTSNLALPTSNTVAINPSNSTLGNNPANFKVAVTRQQLENLNGFGHTTVENTVLTTDLTIVNRQNLTTGYNVHQNQDSSTNNYFWTQASNGIGPETSTLDYMINPIGGKVAIGTVNINDIANCANCNDYRLFVAEGIRTEKVRVDIASLRGWADFVFDDSYTLMPLGELEKFIKKNNHLPNIPSADEVVKKGIDLAEMDAKLLEKIEELTLHTIENNKNNEALEKEKNEQKALIESLMKRMELLEQKAKQ